MSKEIRDFLYSPIHLTNKIKRKETMIRELKSCLLPSAIGYDVEKVKTSPKDQISAIMSKIDELEREIANLKKQKMQAILQVNAAINELDDEDEKTILMEFFIGRMRMDDIARQLNYEFKYLYKLRARAIKKIAEMKKREKRETET